MSYFSFFVTNIQLGIEVAINVKNLRRTLLLAKHKRRKLSHVYAIRNALFMSIISIFKTKILMYEFSTKVN